MQESQLIVILKTFSKKELRELEKWLESPSHNQRQDVRLLLRYLTSHDTLDREKQLKKEKIFAKIFPREPFDDAKLRQTMHFLLRAVEEFLVYEEFQENTTFNKVLLATAYRKRKLDKPFHKAIRTAEEAQTSHFYQHEDYLRNTYLIEQEKNIFQSARERTTRMNFQELSDTLDTSYVASKLLHSCAMLSHQAVYKIPYDTGLLPEVLQFVEQKSLLHVPAIAIYYYIYRMLTEADEPKYFEELLLQIQSNGHLFPIAEIQVPYLHAINYCMRKVNLGESAYLRTSFELLKQGLAKNIFIINGILDPNTFINVALHGFRLQELEWLDYFIHHYKDYLEEQHRDNFYRFTLARLRFEQKDYDAAMLLLAQTDFDDILIQLNAKTMLLKMYYELEETDALESLLESMRTYVNRKEVLSYHRSNYQNIIRYTKKLVRLNHYDNPRKEKLRQEITTANPLTERDWLLRQLDKI
jgi:hypothetical protein